MIKNILNVEGIKTLNKNQQQSISGGEYYSCIAHCAGHCSLSGICYEFIK